jgi:hypothetical protein
MKKREIKINTIVTINNNKYICIEGAMNDKGDETCDGCVFKDKTLICEKFICSRYSRSDGESICFKKISSSRKLKPFFTNKDGKIKTSSGQSFPIKKNPEVKTKVVQKHSISVTDKAIEYLRQIGEAEPEMLVALTDVLKHVSNTYSDKYEGAKNILDTKKQLYHPKRGQIINIYQISRYLQRFMSEGYQKSGNTNDIKKIIHYALFELIRTQLLDAVKDIDVKD